MRAVGLVHHDVAEANDGECRLDSKARVQPRQLAVTGALVSVAEAAAPKAEPVVKAQ